MMEARERYPELATLLSRLKEAVPLEAVVLFGSRAQGSSEPDSDWDLCLVIPEDEHPGEWTPYVVHGRLGYSFGLEVDLVVARTSDLEERKDDVGSMAYDIVRDGRVVYGRLASELAA